MPRINQLNQNLGIPESRSAEALLLGSLCILPENSLTLGKKKHISIMVSWQQIRQLIPLNNHYCCSKINVHEIMNTSNIMQRKR
jgi:hypothetical protein